METECKYINCVHIHKNQLNLGNEQISQLLSSPRLMNVQWLQVQASIDDDDRASDPLKIINNQIWN